MIETLKEVVLNCDTMLTPQLFDSNKNDETIHVDENADKRKTTTKKIVVLCATKNLMKVQTGYSVIVVMIGYMAHVLVLLLKNNGKHKSQLMSIILSNLHEIIIQSGLSSQF